MAAFLLFSVQPLIARTVLPTFGGAPAVWTVCMLFFQAALLAGYLYAHILGTYIPRLSGWLLHTLLLTIATSFYPLHIAPTRGSMSVTHSPAFALFAWLIESAGLPVFVLASTAPLLQSWFARSSHRSARDPYFLSISSNLGSLLALLAYPFWIERHWSLDQQAYYWVGGFVNLALLILICGLSSVFLPNPNRKSPRPSPDSPPIPLGRWLSWIALAAIPSSLMLGVTTALTTDLAAFPLLWIVPLALYLLSFILVFSRWGDRLESISARLLPPLVMLLAVPLGAGLVQLFWIPLHLLTFFIAAVFVHGVLARRRPPADRLTAFYLALAFGGVLGGLFNALLAPSLFNSVAEYPIALVAAAFVLAFRPDHPGPNRRDPIFPGVIGGLAALLCADVRHVSGTTLGAFATIAAAGLTLLVAFEHRKRPARFALTIGALLAATTLVTAVNGDVLLQTRNFFGVLKVTRLPGTRTHRLFHGNTLHGEQRLDPDARREPLTYFTRTGPIGDVFRVYDDRPHPADAWISVTGLGVGSLASYAKPGQHWIFYEIDPEVVRVARDPRYFTYLADCRAIDLEIIEGDARRNLSHQAVTSSLIILDAFSSDAIPVHLLTREALAAFREKLTPDGWIVINITNRYLDLAPVVAALALDAGMTCRIRADRSVTPLEKSQGKQGSIWAVLAPTPDSLGPLAQDPRWTTPPIPLNEKPWTDQYSSTLDHFHF